MVVVSAVRRTPAPAPDLVTPNRRVSSSDRSGFAVQIDGHLEDGAATVGTYDYVVGDKKVSVALDNVSVTWTGCQDGSDATE